MIARILTVTVAIGVTSAPLGSGQPTSLPLFAASGVRLGSHVATVGGAASGAIRLGGSVAFRGTPPEAVPVDMRNDDYCEGAHQGMAVPRQDLLVGPNGGLENVLVFVREGLPESSWPAPNESAVLDQVGCIYQPHVLPLRTGQELLIRNSDETMHNVHVHSEEQSSFNIGQPFKGIEARRVFENSEMVIRVACDIHGWMEGFIAVFDHPFFALTGADGRFELGDLPEGDYVLEAWHETLGSQTARVTVQAGAEADVTFEFGG